MFFSNKLSAVVVKAFRVVNTFSRLNISSSKIGFSWGGGGSGCGSVGRAVAYEPKDHGLNPIIGKFYLNLYWNEKEAGNGPFKNMGSIFLRTRQMGNLMQ